jgi:hypothetical protein
MQSNLRAFYSAKVRINEQNAKKIASFFYPCIIAAPYQGALNLSFSSESARLCRFYKAKTTKRTFEQSSEVRKKRNEQKES